MSGESAYLYCGNGTILTLEDYGADVSGTEPIPVEYLTRRGYRQQGVTVDGYYLNARTLSVRWASSFRSDSAFWQERDRLIAALSPQNNQMMVYRKVLPTGGRRDIQGWLSSGPEMSVYPDRSGYDVSFQIMCPDPAFYDPATQVVTLESITPEALVFPVVFYADGGAEDDGFWFGDSSIAQAAFTYAGSWRCYPTFVITGPYNWLRLENVVTGASLTLSVPLSAGMTLTIDLTPGAQSITDNLGNNRMADKTAGSFVDWYLDAGTNSVFANGSGVSGATQISMIYYNKYVGI